MSPQFGVKDILVEERGRASGCSPRSQPVVPEKDCYTLRVALLETRSRRYSAARDEGRRAARGGRSSTRKPCMPLTRFPGGGSPHPTLGAGGRLALRSAHELLVSIGGFRGENEMIPPRSTGRRRTRTGRS
jgi:hypothetical protein